MDRINLKQVKEALETIPDEILESMFLTHHMAIEDPETDFGLIWWGDNWSDLMGRAHACKGFKILDKWAKEVDNDSKKVCAAKLDEDLTEHYSEQEQ